ncbi:stAR-related lipid transfer protein 6 isoform X2 [Echinops telfairi]|uniref:StAR-related lipid transfer protein 6 isoform X2 n=1 Tax=Echinops telfairi TaxID=9371 RepID=A0AC55DK34_ECHTE|nr:stAR-related lipid transfer protein 6 isoform X2 [Echinops telfairi]
MDYKAVAQQTAQEVLDYSQDTAGWKVVKTSKNIIVSKKASKIFNGNIYRVEGTIPQSTSRLCEFLYPPEHRIKWDKSLKVLNMVRRIDSDTYICHAITQSFAMGSISPRDFIDLVHIKHYEGNIKIISSNSVDLPEYPPSSNYIRGYNHPSGYVCSPLPESTFPSKPQRFLCARIRHEGAMQRKTGMSLFHNVRKVTAQSGGKEKKNLHRSHLYRFL